MYATLQDLIDRFGSDELIQLTDRAPTPAYAIDATVVDRAREDARQLIDGYLATRYQLPLAAPVPDLVRRIACDLARHYLHGGMPGEIPETVKDAYREAIRLLEKIASGTLVLQAAGVTSPAAMPEAAFIAASPRPLRGW